MIRDGERLTYSDIIKQHMVSKSVIPRIGIDNEGNGSPALHYRKKMYTSNIVKALKMPLRGDIGLHQKIQHVL